MAGDAIVSWPAIAGLRRSHPLRSPSRQGKPAICAEATSRFDVKLPLQIAALDASSGRIVLKNSQNDRSRKSRFRAPNLICAGNRHDEAHTRATRGKIARTAEPLPNFPSRSPTPF